MEATESIVYWISFEKEKNADDENIPFLKKIGNTKLVILALKKMGKILKIV